MLATRRHLAPALLVLLAPSALAPAAEPTPNYAADRAERAAGLTSPFGWFSLVALEWLQPGTTTVGSAPGSTVRLPGAPAHLLSVGQRNGKVTVLAADPSLRLGKEPVRPGSLLSDGEGDNDALSSGTLRLWAIARGDRRYLRIKNSDAPARLHFHGLRWYAPDPSLRITARWVPFSTPHTLTTHNQIGQSYDTPVPGYVEFTLGGATHRLLPLSTSDESLWFVFRDDSYRTTTYGGGRFLYTEPPSNGPTQPGTVVIDFNQAVNPPCAYSPFATCPLAAPENRLSVAIAAGEKRYAEDEEAQPAGAAPHSPTRR